MIMKTLGAAAAAFSGLTLFTFRTGYSGCHLAACIQYPVRFFLGFGLRLPGLNGAIYVGFGQLLDLGFGLLSFTESRFCLL